VIDLVTRQPYDSDPATAGLQGLPVQGTWIRQIRRDPVDPDHQTLLVLTTGIERVDLHTGEVSWAVSEEAFVAAGIDDHSLPQSFDVSSSGDIAYVAAYAADFSEVGLFRVGLDGNDPAVPESFAGGFDSVERTLEVTGNTLWYGSTRLREPGLWAFDLGVTPPTVLDGPIATGLPPYAVTVMGAR
jgi:hypothetical protein